MKRRGGRSRSVRTKKRENGTRKPTERKEERVSKRGGRIRGSRSDRDWDRFRSAAFTSPIAALLVGHFIAAGLYSDGEQPRTFGV